MFSKFSSLIHDVKQAYYIKKADIKSETEKPWMYDRNYQKGIIAALVSRLS